MNHKHHSDVQNYFDKEKTGKKNLLKKGSETFDLQSKN